MPVAVLLVAFVALLNGMAWALVMPPFQVADENVHVAYVQHLAETGHRPLGDGPYDSSELREVFDAMRTGSIVFRPDIGVPSGPEAAGADARIAAARELPRDDGAGRSNATKEPPAAYVLYAVPYLALDWATLPTRVLGMRAASVILFALTAALVALIVGHLLPGVPWAPLVGGMSVALQPQWAQSLSGVNSDALLATISAASVLVLLRLVRHGISTRRGLVLGALLGLGLVTKTAFIPIAAGGVLAFAFLAWRDRHRPGTPRILGAAAVGAVPVGLVILYAASTGGGTATLGSGVGAAVTVDEGGFSLRVLFSYAWQTYLPRLPSMQPFHSSGLNGPVDIWVDGLIGRYGWLDASGPLWSLRMGRGVYAVAALALIAAFFRNRTALVRRAPEAALLLGLFALLAGGIAVAGYGYSRTNGGPFEQARYLVPVAGLYGGAWALACLAAGRRWAPVLAAGAIVVFCLHDLSGLLVVTGRYYA